MPRLLCPLVDMYKETLYNGKLPDSLEQAFIILLLKPGKEANLCGSYGPISLLNMDYKILAKIIANRLAPLVPELVAMDQTGFVINRSSYDNIQRFYNILYFSKKIKVPVLAVSLDAEKAFDRVEWSFLFCVLEKMNFGPRFMAMIKTLYQYPKAAILTNYDISSQFPLTRGTRQGCPLSPLLFAQVIEPLAIAIRSNSQIHGVLVGNVRHTISLYADNIMLFLTKPEISFPVLVDLLETYGSISGYKVNNTKSIIMPLNLTAEVMPKLNIPFSWNDSCLTYLGLQISNKLDQAFALNHGPLLKKVGQE